MKKTIIFVIVMIFTMSSIFAFAADRKSNSDKPVEPVKTENKLSEVELNRLTNRVNEIRNLDKSSMTIIEKYELKKELRHIKKEIKRSDGIYIGGAALILLIILIIVLV